MPVALRTEQLHLHEYERDDVEAVLALTAARIGYQPERSLVEARVERRIGEAQRFGLRMYAIRTGRDATAVGYCGVFVGFAGSDEPEIGYELHPSLRGRGLATEAARAVVNAAFTTGRTCLWATTRPDNPASLRILEKLAFVEHHRENDADGPRIFLALSRR